MENRKFTVSGSVLNGHTDVVFDTYIQKTFGYNAPETITYYPVKIQLINGTGQDAEVNILSNMDEYAEYLATPANFRGFTVKSGITVNLSSTNILPSAHKMIVNVPSGTCSGNFDIDCIQYVPRR